MDNSTQKWRKWQKVKKRLSAKSTNSTKIVLLQTHEVRSWTKHSDIQGATNIPMTLFHW